MTPRFSVVMPTFNRADTLRRAIASVQAQHFGDFELLVVDDGSTDETAELLDAIDEPRLTVIAQENQGVAGARNAALRAARAPLIAFLDSDDAWPAHHLELMAAFFDAHPDEQLATSEFWEIFGPGVTVRHFTVEMGEWYPATAARIGSRRFDAPAPLGDVAMRFYETRTHLGEWAAPALEGTGFLDRFHYRGHLFPLWRWGWLCALQPTVLRRELLAKVGLFDERYTVASDFPWLAKVCEAAPMNMFSVPGCYKHELSSDGAPPKEGHLVTGKTAVRFHEDVLRATQELFVAQAPKDEELRALEGLRHYLVGHWALQQGQRDKALEHLEAAERTYRGADVEAALWLARALPRDAVAGGVYRASLAALRLPSRVRAAVHRLTAGAGA